MSYTGVIEKMFELAKYPVLGTWKILVSNEFDEMLLCTSHFKVEEFSKLYFYIYFNEVSFCVIDLIVIITAIILASLNGQENFHTCQQKILVFKCLKSLEK